MGSTSATEAAAPKWKQTQERGEGVRERTSADRSSTRPEQPRATRWLDAERDRHRQALGRIAAGPNDAPYAEPWSRAEALIALKDSGEASLSDLDAERDRYQQENARLDRVVDEKIESVGELVRENERLRALVRDLRQFVPYEKETPLPRWIAEIRDRVASEALEDRDECPACARDTTIDLLRETLRDVVARPMPDGQASAATEIERIKLICLKALKDREASGWRVGDRVLVTSVEQAGEVTVLFEDGRLYVRLDDGDVIATGPASLASQDRGP
jgi:hypothetical protein